MSILSKPFNRSRSSQKEVDWEREYLINLPKVYNYFRYHTGDDTIAEDLTGATFEKAWRYRKKFRRELAGVSTWLFSIARNVMIDHYRQRRREIRLEESRHLSEPSTPESTIENRFELAWLHQQLSRLPDRERELITLKYGAGLTNRDISELTGLSETNVGTILYRVVRKLRAAWENGGTQ